MDCLRLDEVIAQGSFRDSENDTFWLLADDDAPVGIVRLEDLEDPTPMFDLRLDEAHMKRAAEWFLTLREMPLERAHELIASPTLDNRPGVEESVADDTPTQLYDTGLDAGEG